MKRVFTAIILSVLLLTGALSASANSSVDVASDLEPTVLSVPVELASDLEPTILFNSIKPSIKPLSDLEPTVL